ncbi:MAG: exo-alpha-sialidase [Verrucomicrobia bacterium]|nr:exo-alpha-sialidase [Verrucomicrobiota bacterium]
MKRRTFFQTSACLSTAALSPNLILAADTPLIKSIEKITLRKNRSGKGITWFHPRPCMIPPVKGDKTPVAFMTLQEIAGSDFFGPVHSSQSLDLGKTWSDPNGIAPLARFPVAGHEGLEQGVCDVVPQYHPSSKSILALGHNVFYRGKHFSRKDQLPRFPTYSVRRPDGTWSDLKKLQWDDPRGAFIYTNNCGQRVVLPDGDIIMSFTFGPTSAARSVAGVRCSFDGETLKIKEVGPAITSNKGRGLLEPSVTQFNGKFYMTIRAEDNHGYLAVSDDGLNYSDKIPWAWDDGEPLTMSTTQQHWLTHSDGLFLVYTRKDKSNSKVIRWRAPLFVARVDPGKLCLIRSSEQVVLPLVGDGNNDPDNVALMGNFAVTNISPEESWVTAGEWMPKKGARGDVVLGRIRWSKANRLPLY